jgi:hypothetical protein
MLSAEFQFGNQCTLAKTSDDPMGILFPRFGNFQMRLKNRSIRDIFHTPVPIKVFRFSRLLRTFALAFTGSLKGIRNRVKLIVTPSNVKNRRVCQHPRDA